MVEKKGAGQFYPYHSTIIASHYRISGSHKVEPNRGISIEEPATTSLVKINSRFRDRFEHRWRQRQFCGL